MNNKEVSLSQSISPNKTFTCFVVGETSLLIRCVKHLLQQGHIVQGIFSKDAEVNVWANQQGMTCFKNQQLWLQQPQKFDYLFSIVNSWVIPSEILALPRKGAINYHDSPLPRYAGVNATVHALRHNEPRHGISWHEIAEGIDTGDILQQAWFDILPDDTALSLNIRCYEAAFSAFAELVQALTEETVNPIKQNLAERSYYGRWDRPEAACVLNWNDTAEQLDALIRALNMGIYRNTVGLPKCLIGERLFIPSQTEVLATASTQAPGTLLTITDTKIKIATGTQDLAIHQLLSIEGESLPASEWVQHCNVQVGQVLPSLNAEKIQKLSQLDNRYCRHEAYWRRQLSAVTPVSLHSHRTMLASDTSLPPYTQIRYHQAYDAVFLTLSFAVLLARFTQSYTLTLGFSSPVLRQDITGYEHYFAKQIPLNLQIEAQQTFSEMLQSVHKQLDELHNKGTYLYDLILREPMLTAPNDLFSIAWVEHAQDSLLQQRSDKLLIEATGACCYWPKALQYLATHYQQLNNAIIQYPDTPLYQLPLLDKQAIQQLQAWNKTQTDYPKDGTIKALFEEQVAKTPDNIAVVFEGEQLSYRQLNAKANQLAHYLLKHPTLENASNPLIAIAVERSLSMVIGLLGILKAGGAYVPIDPNYPAERVAYLLKDSAASVLLTQSALQAQFPLTQAALICLDELVLSAQSALNPNRQSQPDDLAYLIYTSGSTGLPKGVMVEHQALTLHIQAMLQTYSVQPEDRVLQFASMGFDTALEQLLVAWLNGACSVLVKDNVMAADDLVQLLQTQAVSMADLPPAYWQQMLGLEGLAEALPALHTLILGGEALPLDLARQTRERFPTLTCFNAYGPTEAVITPTLYRLPSRLDKESLYVSIGQPRANTQVFVLDKHEQVQPIGIAGELCIAGAGLARGYLNRPELEKFVEIQLFGESQRIYKTGDLARWLPSGQLDYLGRIDNQVKLRGFRIELGEIEAVLLQYAVVKQTAVVLLETDENKRLVAYISTDAAHDDLVADLKAYLKTQLPDYMVPAVIMVLDALPLTPNGKIDRQALPAPDIRRENQFEAPRNEVERELASIWKAVLNRDDVSIHDNFFSLGGDSILSLQVVARTRQIGLQFSPRDLFEHQTIAELASAVRSEVEIEAEQSLVSGEVPLTPIQRWFFATDFPEYWHFNQSFLLMAPLNLSVDALQQAFAAVLTQHDALRLRYALVDETWQQRFAELSNTLPFSIEDLSDSTDIEAYLLHSTEHYQTSLNLQDGPLTRLVVFKLSDSVRVFWCIHHLVVDGVSWRILLEDLYTAYNQAVAGETIQLPNKTSSFKAWAQRLNAYAHSEAVQQELSYWQSVAVQPLPVDKPDGQNRLEYTQHYSIEWNTEITRALLNETSAAYNTHINDILLAALALAFKEWTGNTQCVIDLETHGRVNLFNEIDLSGTVGWFTSIHPLTLSVEEDLGTTLKAVQAQRQSIPNEGIGHGLLTYLCGESLPRGNILFNYLGQFDQNADNGYFRFASETTYSPMSDKGGRDHLIEINGMVSQGQLHFLWSFSQNCYHASTIETLANHYKRHLTQLIQHCQTQGQPKLETALLLRQGSKTTALFCVPGLGSKAGYFRPLAKQLQTTQTIYGLESLGLEGRYPIPKTVEALAQQHLDVIRHFQPKGPYYLLGHSFGAAVVLEIAWQLEQLGETVALVAIVDLPTLQSTPNASRPLHTTEFYWLWRIVGTFQLLAGIELPFDLNQLKQTHDIQTACEQVMAWLKQSDMHELLFSKEARTEELLAYVKVYQANETAFLSYQAIDKTLRGAIDLFYTDDSKKAWDQHDKLPDDWGWGRHTDEVRTHQLSGAHFSVFNRPYVQTVAKILEVHLQNTALSQ